MQDPTNNPYQSPDTVSERPAGISLQSSRSIVGLIMAALLVGTVTSFLSFGSITVRNFLMPRFGWTGLLLWMNVAILLGAWLKTPKRRLLYVSACMSLLLATMEALQLIWKGSVSVVANPFHDRLHSSWAWSVLPMVVTSLVLVWIAGRQHDDVGEFKT